jgi:hypothetical protein
MSDVCVCGHNIQEHDVHSDICELCQCQGFEENGEDTENIVGELEV